MTFNLLDLFCGVGGWSKSFRALGWRCVGVDIADLGYAGDEFLQCDVLELDRDYIDSFDGVVASPPCEEFARAWMPWLRMDKTPSAEALALLQFSIALCDRPNRLTECSKFAARHEPHSRLAGSYALWGDVPALLPFIPARKEKLSGKAPHLCAEIPCELGDWIARCFTNQLRPA